MSNLEVGQRVTVLYLHSYCKVTAQFFAKCNSVKGTPNSRYMKVMLYLYLWYKLVFALPLYEDTPLRSAEHKNDAETGKSVTSMWRH